MTITINGSGTITGASTLATAISSPTLTTPTISGNANMTGGTKYQVSSVTTNAIAWVNFNASSGSSAVIRSSYNVSSVTYNSTGTYTINYTNALSDANYCITGTATGPSYGATTRVLNVALAPTTTSVQVAVTTSTTAASVDSISTNVAIFGN
jgi:hypothetical protein